MLAAAKGVIVEFDFAALDGADILFDVACRHLMALDGIELDRTLEARYLAGRSYEEGLTSLFKTVRTKKTPQKAARDLAAAFAAAITEAAPKGLTPAFRNFVSALAERGVKVVIATRSAPESDGIFDPIMGEGVSLFRETSACYGFPRWDSWRRACVANGLKRAATAVATGSGYGVKSALLAGMGSMAVQKGSVAYQDYTGADIVVPGLSGVTAKRLLAFLRV